MTFALIPAMPSASKVLATLNPNDKSARITLSGGNLTATGDGTANAALVRATFPILRPSYWEVALSGVGNTASGCVDIMGVQDGSISTASLVAASGGIGAGWGYASDNGNNYVSAFTSAGVFAALGASGTFGFAFDPVSGKFWCRNSGGYLYGDPAAGTSPCSTQSGGLGTPLLPAVSFFTNAGSAMFNFGASAFTYAVPSGFTAGVYTLK